MITIEFSGSQARIVDPLSAEVNEYINNSLMFRDKSVQYDNLRWGTQKDDRVFCYNPKDQTFAIGLMLRVRDLLDQCQIEHQVKATYNVVPKPALKVPSWAYPHQVKMVDVGLEKRMCCLQSPTGSGKSNAAGFFINQFPDCRALVVVPSSNLLVNMVDTLQKVLNEPIGIVKGGGKKNQRWERVTVGIVNSLSIHRIRYKAELLAIDVLVIDEAHLAASDFYQSVCAACKNTSYRLGLTATYYRKDGAEMLIEAALGPLSYKVSDVALVEKGRIHSPEVFYLECDEVEHEYEGASWRRGLDGRLGLCYPRNFNNKPNPQEVYKVGIINNQERNELAVKVIKEFIKTGCNDTRGTVLLLFNHQVHGIKLFEMVEEAGISCQYIDFRVTGKARQNVLDSFRAREFDCLVASNVLNVGEDVPSLELIVNAAGGSSKNATVQRTGRGLRIDPSGVKRRSLYVDFLDKERYFLKNASLQRRNYIEERFPECSKVVSLNELFRVFENVNQRSSVNVDAAEQVTTEYAI
jgi:superfamily II DNA or RNA helicase